MKRVASDLIPFQCFRLVLVLLMLYWYNHSWHQDPLFHIISYITIMLYFIFPELGGLLKFVRPFLISISKAKAARLVRSLLDLFLDMEAATGQEVELCLECIEWAKAEKRTFLRQALEVTMFAVYMTFREAAWMSSIVRR